MRDGTEIFHFQGLLQALLDNFPDKYDPTGR